MNFNFSHNYIIILSVLLAIVCFECADKGQQAGSGTPATNIILLMSDDQGWGDVAYNGNSIVKTPRLDHLAASSIKLDRFYAAAPVCSPTRASCLTGRHPVRLGIPWADTGHLPMEEQTLAEVLKKEGYATGHFGKWHVGTLSRTERDATRGGAEQSEHYSPPWENGFDRCFSTETMVPLYNPMVWGAGEFKLPQPADDYKFIMDRPVAEEETADMPGVYEWYTSYWTGESQKVENLKGDDSQIIMDQALQFIREQTANETSFFTVIWFHAVHSPIAAGDKHRAIYAKQNLSIEEEHWYGSLSAMDEQIGRLEDELKKLGVFDNTLLWFCSDNGPSYIHDFNSAGPYRGKKGTLYEGGIRVPAFISWPNHFKDAKTIDAPMGTSDFYPTILSAINRAPGHDLPMDGIDVLPILEGKVKNRNNPIFFQSPMRGKDWRVDSTGWQYAVSDDAFKLISVDGGNSYSLFNLLKDEGETVDIAEDYPEIHNKLKHQLNEWLKTCKKSAEGADYY